MQIEVAFLTTILSVYYHLDEYKDESGFLWTYFWLVANVIITVIVVMINLGQIQSARRLIKAANEVKKYKICRFMYVFYVCVTT